MNLLRYYILGTTIFFAAMGESGEINLLQEGFASLAVSTECIESIYVQALEKDLMDVTYEYIGADWEIEANNKEPMLAGLHVVQEHKILFIDDKSFESTSEIAFEDARKTKRVKLSKADLAEINDAIIFSQIKAKTVDPKSFDVHLDEVK